MVRSAYLDTSALLKLVRVELETTALREFTRNSERFSSELSQIELKRAGHRKENQSRAFREKARAVASVTQTIPMDQRIMDLAGDIEEPNLGTLDAIHISTAISAAPFDCFITYDKQQARAAQRLGLNVVTPRDAI